MKKVIIIALMLIGFGARAQVGYTLCVYPDAWASGDSIKLNAKLNATGGYQSITWKYISGPTSYSIGPAVQSWQNTMILTSSVVIKKLTPGNYVFAATGLSKDSLSATMLMPVYVAPQPLPATPRMAVSIGFTIAGVPFTLPFVPGLVTVKYADGSTQ